MQPIMRPGWHQAYARKLYMCTHCVAVIFGPSEVRATSSGHYFRYFSVLLAQLFKTTEGDVVLAISGKKTHPLQNFRTQGQFLLGEK